MRLSGAFWLLSVFVAVLSVQFEPIPLLGNEGELWTKNLKYQPVSAFWSSKPAFYFATEPIHVFANNLKLRCGNKPSCFCFESPNVMEFSRGKLGAGSACPKGFAFVCFTATPDERASRSLQTDGMIRVEVPGTSGTFGYEQGNPPLTPHNVPRTLMLPLEGGVIDLHDFVTSYTLEYVGAEMPMFTYFYGYREDSDIPEPVVRLSTAGCASDLRLSGIVHGPIYARARSERRGVENVTES